MEINRRQITEKAKQFTKQALDSRLPKQARTIADFAESVVDTKATYVVCTAGYESQGRKLFRRPVATEPIIRVQLETKGGTTGKKTVYRERRGIKVGNEENPDAHAAELAEELQGQLPEDKIFVVSYS